MYAAYAYWAADLDIIFTTIQSYFTINSSPACSTHVHISGISGPFSPPELAVLAKAALYHETALDHLVPAVRRGSSAYWCQSNRSNPALKHLPDLDACFHRIDQAFDASRDKDKVLPLVEAMNLFPAASAYGKAHGKTKDFVRGKVYKWNFSGMVPGYGQGTVEFRQAPGSLVAEDAAGWITLLMAFVAGAISVGPYGDEGSPDGATLDELWALLANGAQALGWESLGAVEELFSRAA